MTSIQMPQLGETIVEGTILKWLKQEGEHIDVDEPLFELSTDKVDTEVPSPVSGTVTKILVAEGTTVAVGTALAEVEAAPGSVAMRLAIGPSPRRIELPDAATVTPGHGSRLVDGADALLVAYGPVLLHETLTASETLRARGVRASVIAMPWLNVVDTDWLADAVGPYRHIVVVEDHAPVGALGDALRRALAATGLDQGRTIDVLGVEGWPACGTPPEALRAHGLDARLDRGSRRGGGRRVRRAMSGERVWVVLAEELATRVFVQCGILAKLHERLGDRLVAVNLLGDESSARWEASIGVPVVPRAELLPWKPSVPEKARRKADTWLDRQIGFFPLAIRFNERHGFHAERMMPGHPNRILDSSLAGPLPHNAAVERAMTRWFFSARRHVPSALERRLREDCGLLVLANLQVRACVPFLAAARRLRLPAVGYVASWDHTVGKGVLSPHLERYVVQNRAMRDDLERYHGIGPERVVVTGWPQTDVFHRRRPRAEYEALLRGYGLDPARPLVLVAGNTPTNAPVRGAVRRAARGLVAGHRARPRLAALPAASA